VLEPYELQGAWPAQVQKAKRVWMVKTGGIADDYAKRLVERGFVHTVNKDLPSGSQMKTRLWLFERPSP
jgi:hypothetical protein